MKSITPTNNLKFNFPDIAKEWHPTKNDDLKPSDVVKYANRKAWWLCKNGHEWQKKLLIEQCLTHTFLKLRERK